MNRWIVGASLALLPLQASAHHSGAMFDRTKTLTVAGVVKQYDYTSPHSWITLVVLEPGGGETLWGIEGFTPASMKQWGIVPSTVKPGDKVSVVTHPLRDGRHGGSLVEITLANGRRIDTTSDERRGVPANP